MKSYQKPKKYDCVERIDLSKTCGTVIKILSNSKVLVGWGCKEITQEKIKDLALVSR